MFEFLVLVRRLELINFKLDSSETVSAREEMVFEMLEVRTDSEIAFFESEELGTRLTWLTKLGINLDNLTGFQKVPSS